MEEWCARLDDETLLGMLSGNREWVLRCTRAGFRPHRVNRTALGRLRRECRRRGLCTKAARPRKVGHE